jgi:hypothetical protein
MKHKILAILMFTAAVSTVACSDDKGSSAGGPQTCATNPTLPGCSLQQAALAQVPGAGSPAAAALAARGIVLTPPGAPQTPLTPPGVPPVAGTTPPQTGVGIAVTSKAIQAQAAKVQAALEADSQNPESSHYAGQSDDGGNSRAPASIAPVTQSSVALAPPALEGGGEAAK